MIEIFSSAHRCEPVTIEGIVSVVTHTASCHVSLPPSIVDDFQHTPKSLRQYTLQFSLNLTFAPSYAWYHYFLKPYAHLKYVYVYNLTSLLTILFVANCPLNIMKFLILNNHLTFEFALLSALIHLGYCIRFNLEPHSKRCLKHEMYSNQLAVGEYEISSFPDTIVDVTIKDTKGHIAFTRENIDGKGKFAVTSDNADFYELCFIYSSPKPSQQLMPREVYVDYRVGVEAKQYDPASEDKLSQLERDLTRIEDITESIITDFAYLKKREQEMRDTNESTNNRLFYQTITSVIILLVLTTWQILYMRTFFKARKLID